MKPNPNSRTSRALLALANAEMSVNDFLHAIAAICPDKRGMNVVINNLKERGFTERRIGLTQEGRAAVERIRQ